MYTLKQPSTNEEFKAYYHLRWKLLRKPWGQPEGSEVDEIENNCYHIMAIDNKQLIIGIARLQFNTEKVAQIRYMAVVAEHERQGVGRLMMHALEQQAKQKNIKTIILDAREPAIGFYEKLGYRITQKTYLLFNEIQHFKMQKKL